MKIKYYKLFDILNRRGMTKTDLKNALGISTRTLAKLSNHQHVSLRVIENICMFLKTQPGDIMEIELADTIR